MSPPPAPRGPSIAALALVAAALLAHLIVAHNGPTWTSPLVLGDWLFGLLLALAIPAYALALGRRIARPLLDPDPDADPIGESLAALGLGLGALSLATLGLGFLRLYYAPLFLALWLALTLWLRPELRRIWRQTAHSTARWLRAGMPSAPTIPQRLALLVLLLTVPSVLLRTAAPVTEWDAVIYHLASLKLYLAAHAIIPLPDLPLANNPSGAEMLLLPSLMAGASGVGKLFNLACALLMGLATHNLGRRYLGASSAWIGVLLFFSPLWLQLVLPLTLTDFASSLLGLLAIADAATWTQRAANSPRPDPSPLPHLQHTTEPNATSPHPSPSRAGSPPSSPASYTSYGQAASHNAPAAHPNPAMSHGTDTRAQVPAPTAVAPSLPFDRSRRPHVLAPHDRLLIRAGLFAGLSVSFKLTSAPAPPTLALTIGLASLMLHRGGPVARILAAIRNGTLATVAAAIPLAPWLLKNYYFFHHPISGVAVAVSNPSHGITVDAATPSRLDHAHWIAQSFVSLLWNHLGPLSLALLLAPLLLRRPEQRVLLIYFLSGSLLWLLFVPFYEPPRYYLSLVALAAALIAGSLGAALAALRPRPTTPTTEHTLTSPPHDPPVPATASDPLGSGSFHDPLGSGRVGAGSGRVGAGSGRVGAGPRRHAGPRPTRGHAATRRQATLQGQAAPPPPPRHTSSPSCWAASWSCKPSPDSSSASASSTTHSCAASPSGDSPATTTSPTTSPPTWPSATPTTTCHPTPASPSSTSSPATTSTAPTATSGTAPPSPPSRPATPAATPSAPPGARAATPT